MKRRTRQPHGPLTRRSHGRRRNPARLAAGTILTGSAGPFVLNLGSGVRGTAVGNSLKLAASLDIVGGVIRYAGVVWGVEESA